MRLRSRSIAWSELAALLAAAKRPVIRVGKACPPSRAWCYYELQFPGDRFRHAIGYCPKGQCASRDILVRLVGLHLNDRSRQFGHQMEHPNDHQGDRPVCEP